MATEELDQLKDRETESTEKKEKPLREQFEETRQRLFDTIKRGKEAIQQAIKHNTEIDWSGPITEANQIEEEAKQITEEAESQIGDETIDRPFISYDDLANEENEQEKPLDADRAKEAEELEQLIYDSIENYPELLDIFNQTTEILNTIRQRQGLKPIEFKTSDVHLLNFEGAKEALKRNDLPNGFYQMETGTAYVDFRLEKMDKKSYQLKIIHTMIHELTHKSMRGTGIDTYSKRLNEGFVDSITRDIMEEHVLPSMLNGEEKEARDTYFSSIDTDKRIVLEDNKVFEYDLQPRDILFAKPGKQPVTHTYIYSMHFLDMLHEKHPDLYESLLKAAYHGNNVVAQELIEKNLKNGQYISEQLQQKAVVFWQKFDLERQMKYLQEDL